MRGFTLLEILIAIAIFAIVLSTIFGTYSSTFRVIHIAESQGDIYRKARIAMTRISEDIAAMQVPASQAGGNQAQAETSGELVGEDGQINGQAADGLHFTSRAHLLFSGGKDGFATAVISYTVKENEKGGGLLLLRSDRPVLMEDSGDRDEGLVLCDGLRGVDFTYQDIDGEMMERWDTTTPEMQERKVAAARLPVMISIRLEFENEAAPEHPLLFMTSVLIPIWQGP